MQVPQLSISIQEIPKLKSFTIFYTMRLLKEL